MDSIKVLVTGAGAPGFYGTFISLKNNYDKRRVDIVGTDMKDDVFGKFMADKFYVIPPAKDDGYLDAIEEIYEKENIDVLLPQNTDELEKLSSSKMRVAGRNHLANDKLVLYRVAEARGVPIPKYMEIQGKVVVKPNIGHGSKGLHIIETEGTNLVSEYLEGDEYTVDCFRGDGKFIAIPRLREEIKNGITWKSKTVKDDDLIEWSRRLAEGCHLKYAFGFQFKGGKLLECNPRVQGTMVASTFAGANIIYSAVKLALKEPIPEFNINWDSRTIRYTICKSI